MPTRNLFNSYTVSINGGNEGRIALLMCFNNGVFAGRIDFYPDGATLPADYLWHPGPGGQYVVLHMPMSRFESVMSMVRHEKPLQLAIDVERGNGAATSGHGSLTTSENEPIGEEEGGL